MKKLPEIIKVEHEKAAQKKWRLANPNYYKKWSKDNAERAKNYYYHTMYRMTFEDYRKMVQAQGGLCAICEKKPFDTGGPNGQLHVDHKHGGSVRGLLCWRCNRALGMFGDDALRIFRAAQYVDNYNA